MALYDHYFGVIEHFTFKIITLLKPLTLLALSSIFFYWVMKILFCSVLFVLGLIASVLLEAMIKFHIAQ